MTSVQDQEMPENDEKRCSGGICREAQGLAVPEDHAIYRTVSGLQEGGLQVWHFMLAWNIMQCCRKSRMSTSSCSACFIVVIIVIVFVDI